MQKIGIFFHLNIAYLKILQNHFSKCNVILTETDLRVSNIWS